MPPKPKYTRDQIIDAAYELARSEGIDAVVAREVGKKLGTTATPIFTFFENMDELKNEIFQKAKRTCLDFLLGCKEYRPLFKEFGLRWVQFAIDEPHLYSFLFIEKNEHIRTPQDLMIEFDEILSTLLDEIRNSFGLETEDAIEILNQMQLHTNGIAVFCVNDNKNFSKEFISKSLSETCLGLVFLMKARNGQLNPMQAQAMASAVDRLPEHI